MRVLHCISCFRFDIITIALLGYRTDGKLSSVLSPFFPLWGRESVPFYMGKNMITIIKGTTPTIKYTFSKIDVDEVITAYLTVKQDKDVIIKKGIEDATVDENDILWTLTQEETLRLPAVSVVNMMCNWKLADGTRGASAETKVQLSDNHIPEVI